MVKTTFIVLDYIHEYTTETLTSINNTSMYVVENVYKRR